MDDLTRKVFKLTFRGLERLFRYLIVMSIIMMIGLIILITIMITMLYMYGWNARM